MATEDMRWDNCKCGKRMFWDPWVDEHLICPRCKAEYRVENNIYCECCDGPLAYWLEEKLKTRQPYKTEAR